MKKFLFVILIFISSQTLFTQDTVSSKYFPLKTGNKWFYHVTTLGYPLPTYSILSLSILNDTIINGKKYFKVKGYPFSSVDSNIVFIRYDSTNGILKRTTSWSSCDNEYSLFKLSSQLGDLTGECYADWEYICSRIQDTLLFNQQSTLKGFRHYEGGHNTHSKAHDFLKNIGLYYISMTSTGNAGIFGRIGELQGCIINGVIYGDTTSVIGIQPISNQIPSQFSLGQNYPNPFNPTTQFEFSIPKTGFVNITVYDAMGRQVEVLQNGELKAGTYKADWNASKYPSGIYFYRLKTQEFTQTMKMILVK